jgi:fatty-acyl-CoA synthase
MEFARRARRLYADREAIVDGDLRLTYGQFFERCDRWSSALQALGVWHGDRVAYIAPNTHAHLEAYYAVPQIGAVLVPINYRLAADDFEYIINHCGAHVVSRRARRHPRPASQRRTLCRPRGIESRLDRLRIDAA